MSESQGASKPGKKPYKGKRRPINKNKRPQGQGNSPKVQAKDGAPNKKRSNNNKRRRNYNKNRKGPQGPERVITKYLNLLEQYLQARKKYFSLYFRADPKQLDKLERNYNNSMDKVREFPKSLKENELEVFTKHFDGLKHDHTYSDNHELPKIGDIEVSYEQIEDPHYLVSQKEHEYSEDTEESVGSIEDYKAYKGI